MSDPYHAGQNCKCYANSEVDCCCGADWTDPEIYKLRAENSALREALAQWRILCEMGLQDVVPDWVGVTIEPLWELTDNLVPSEKRKKAKP